jgi:triosephosphate isomerase
MRTQIVAGNWKMNKTFDQGLALAGDLLRDIPGGQGGARVILAVPFIHLKAVADLVSGNDAFSVAAQDCHTEKEGAYTGDVSAPMVASTGAKYVLVGHSERREYHGEDSPVLVKKIKAALEAGLTPIFCCGETKDIREANRHDTYVATQVTDVVAGFSEAELRRMVIAYEPVWAIGTGLTASAEQAQDMHKNIRTALAGQFSEAAAQDVSILYGGSVKANNAQSLFSQPDIDGGLVGGASLNAIEFAAIVAAAGQ